MSHIDMTETYTHDRGPMITDLRGMGVVIDVVYAWTSLSNIWKSRHLQMKEEWRLLNGYVPAEMAQETAG